MKRSELEALIEQEILKYLEEKFNSSPAIEDKPHDVSVYETDEDPMDEAKKRKARPAYGKKFVGRPDEKGKQKSKYWSAGTVNKLRNRKLGAKGSAKWVEREKLGAKLLNTLRRGGKAGLRLKAALTRRMNKLGGPIKGSRGFVRDKWNERDLLNAYVWAMATDWVLKNKTAKDFKIDATDVEKQTRRQKDAAKRAAKKAAKVKE